MCKGAVAGVVAMTPAAGDVSAVGSTVIGLLAGLACAFAISWKYRLGADATLDVVGIHGWGGLFGVMMVGLADTGVRTGQKDLFFGGSRTRLLAVMIQGFFSFVMTVIICKVIDLTIGLRHEGGAGKKGAGLRVRCGGPGFRGRGRPSGTISVIRTRTTRRARCTISSESCSRRGSSLLGARLPADEQ